MNEIEFFPYHNRHIVFKLKNGKELSGVVVSKTPGQSSLSSSIYNYITTNNLVAWKKAEKEDNKQRMRELEEDINIMDIIWAERLNY